jgi:hypothetical protein
MHFRPDFRQLAAQRQLRVHAGFQFVARQCTPGNGSGPADRGAGAVALLSAYADTSFMVSLYLTDVHTPEAGYLE